MPDAVSRAVYRTSHYRPHGQADTTNAADSIYADAGGSRARLRLVKRSGSKGYGGALTVAVSP